MPFFKAGIAFKKGIFFVRQRRLEPVGEGVSFFVTSILRFDSGSLD